MARARGMFPFLLGFAVMMLAGWVLFPRLLYTSSPQPFRFSHYAHGPEGAGMSCTDCHAVGDDGRFTGIPGVARCAECHSAPMGGSPDEAILVEEYVTPNREIPWHAYARQPENVFFPHAVHVTLAGLPCGRCHGNHGTDSTLQVYSENRISGYSRNIWGSSIARVKSAEWDGMKMDDCSACHHERQVRESCLACHK